MLKAVTASSGGGAASGITIGTSVITGGTDKRLFYDNNGVVGETAQWTYNNSTGLLLGNMNAAAAPAAISGTGLQIVGADATVGRVASYSFGAIAAFTVARANGTGAAPTAIVSGDQIGGFNSYGYRTSGGSAYSGPSSSVQSFATENWTSTANGTKIVLATTPNTTTTLTTALTVEQNGNLTLNVAASVLTAPTLAATSNIAMGSGVNSITLSNGATDAFTMVSAGGHANVFFQIGGTSSSFPALMRNATTLAVRLADNSADAAITTAAITASGITSITNATDASASSGSGSLQVAGGASVAKRFWIPAITASAGLQTAVLCQSSGGEMIADSVACLASSARFKTLLGDAENGALDKIIRVPIHRWKYKRDPNSVFPDNYYSEHIGPTAEDIEAIDSRLVGRDQEGKARSISTDQLLALAIQAIQEQQEQIEELRKRA